MNAPHAPQHGFLSDKAVGRLWVLAAAVMWSLCGLFAKAPVFLDWSEATRGPMLAFWRALFAGLVLVPLVRRPRWNWSLVPLGIGFTIMCVTYLSAVVMTTAANAIWLQATSPWWVFLLSVFLFREPIVRRDLIPLGFGAAGVAIILAFELRGQAIAGAVFGLASGVTYACVVILMRHLRRENAAWLVALSHLTAAVVMLPWVVYLGVWPSLVQLVVLVGFGTLQMAIPYLFLIRGLRKISSQEATAIGLIEPVLMPLWVFLVWKEVPAWWTVAGAALILMGLLVRYVGWRLIAAQPNDS